MRFLHVVYCRVTNVFFRVLRMSPLHPIYDYRQSFPALGVDEKSMETFRLVRIGPHTYQSLVGIRRPSVDRA